MKLRGFPIIQKTAALSDISREIGIVFFASVFIEPIMQGRFNFPSITIGLCLSIIALYTSLTFARN